MMASVDSTINGGGGCGGCGGDQSASSEAIALKKAIEQFQSMIEISAEHLDGLRTQCATSAELTQQEIRTLEGKLIKLFSRQLLAKTRIRDAERTAELKQYPQLKQWLTVVGLRRSSAQGICQKVNSLEELLKLTDHEIKSALRENGSKDEEERRLIVALQNLRRCTECLRQGEKAKCNELDLHWDSWDRVSSSGSACSSPKPPRPRPLATPVHDSHLNHGGSNPTSPPMTNSVPNLPWSPGASSTHGGPSTTASFTQLPRHDRRYTPPPTPPTSSKKGEKIRFPTTPPPRKRHQTAVTSLLPESYPLTKSKSHESQLANKIDPSDPATKSDRTSRRPRLLTEPGLESDQDETSSVPALVSSCGGGGSSSLTNSPMRMSPHPYAEPNHQVMEEANYRSQLIAPPSPRTPTYPIVLPQLAHRFKQIIKMTPCDICKKQMIIGLKCKECKLRCHHNCADKSNMNPCLSADLLNFIRMHNDGNHSPILARLVSSPIYRKDGHRDRSAGRHYPLQPLINAPGFQTIDTNSNTSSSSCNSSTPSSPAPNSIMGHTPPILPPHHFDFSDLTFEKNITIDARPLKEVNEMVETQKSNDSDKTMSGTSGSTDSEKTLAGRVDSQDSQVSDIDSFDRSWPRQNSLSFREWEIPYNELVFGEAVGKGRFGTVYRGNWHGEIAIKVFNMDQMDDENALDSFKQEVATFRKTRHENLVLFMGACMKPPHLAIVTRLCKGMTLYTHIHLRHDKFNLNRAIIIAQQVAQGMGYLHARGIVHKDLKTKNVFLESGKVVITDFGLFSVTKLCHGNRKGDWLTIPPGWLCYLAPEVVSCLRASNESHANDHIPFTKASDVYAFGTVWYELVCSEWPFKGQPPEAIIWQVGKGMKQSLANLQASRDVKDILMMCWCYKSSERPEFSTLPKLLEKLPKKRLARSPSHPIQLSRSAESVF